MDATQEQWRPVVDWEGYYEVSDHGRVRSVDRIVELSNGKRRRAPGRVLKPGRVRGHLHVALCKDSKPASRRLHHLVAEAFIGPRPPGMECLHRDDDPDNNCVENLRWGTRSENMHDRVRNGRHHFANQTECLRGHPYTPSSFYYARNGSRQCLVCKRENYHARKAD